MPNQKVYKIGTRGSLLALTQCTQVKNELERLTGDKFELEIIKTQGDLITNAPLWQLDGKDFFTKELDEALLKSEVDLVVHSYKDLGSVRPVGIALAAVTKRTFAHDILLIKKSTIKKLNSLTDFVVGTSSPRRMVNLTDSLKNYIPNGKNLNISTQVLRGNVNTRIQKLVNDEFSAIVLALPGIQRLSLSEKSKLELEKLINNLDFMILPQSIFPSSASQGALGIECLESRNDNGELYNKLKLMEDKITLEEVRRERKAFNDYGGGCHLAVGVNVRRVHDFYLHSHRGELNGEKIRYTELEGGDKSKLKDIRNAFIGLPTLDDQLIKKVPCPKLIKKDLNYFISSRYAIPSLKLEDSYSSLWAAGTKTMEKLSEAGFWVNGSADGLGLEEIKNFTNSSVIKMFLQDHGPVINLTHNEGENEIKVYDREINPVSESYNEKLQEHDLFYWTSFKQYEIYTEKYPYIKNKLHASGLGKTYAEFKKNNVEVIAIHSMDEVKKLKK